MATRHWVDTNVLVRFLTREPPGMAAAAKALVEAADAGEVVLEVLPLIVAETVYTLESFYEMDRQEVASKLILLLQSRGIKPHERGRVLDALARHRDQNVHFADAYLAAVGAQSGVSVASFDGDLDKFKDVRRFEPKA
jgi:predicted nucleic acid-binding protein